MKTKTITVSFGRGSFAWIFPNKPGEIGYRVEKVTDSVEFDPGQVLTKKEVEELCEAAAWKVTIVSVSQ